MKLSHESLLARGMLLPVMEEFYSVQGEGFNTGQTAYFIRIGGCDVGCRWCDVKESWNGADFPPVSADVVVERASAFPAKAVVVTGGEPLLYNLDYLCDRLHRLQCRTFLETSGSQRLSGAWDWICLSPKKDAPPLPEIAEIAQELKVIIHDDSDFDWAEENRKLLNLSCYCFLQPEWSRRNTMMPRIVQYIKNHPEWRISLQSHKYMHIP